MAQEFTFTCSLPGGLHARPAAQLAERANLFSSACSLTNLRNRVQANLKSPLAILAANVRVADACSILASGNDEQAALATLRSFVENDLPKSDDYLPPTIAGEQHRALPRVLKEAGGNCFFGRPVQRGTATGKVVFLDRPLVTEGSDSKAAGGTAQEQQRWKEALAKVQSRIRETIAAPGPAEQKSIMRAQLAIAGDVSLSAKLEKKTAQGQSAGQAVREAGEFFLAIFKNAESQYLQERALDFEDVIQALLEEIHGGKGALPETELNGPTVVVGEALSPQQVLSLNRRWLKAVVLENASATAHGVILARSLGIPTVVGVKRARQSLRRGQEVVVDGNRGLVAADPNAVVRRWYEHEANLFEQRSQILGREAAQPAQTNDGLRLEVDANVAGVEELSAAFKQGADGIGLFRTEMLLAGSQGIPTEDEQFEIYAQAARLAGQRPVTIRTLDIGGDKPAWQLKLGSENNPFLGYRGVRIYPEFRDLVRSQVRAILRASAVGRVQMMVPMVSSLDEVRWVKVLVAELKAELKNEGVAFDPQLPLGIMMETPAAAFMLNALSREVDFFSLGTNDLSQYFFAAERGNDKVAALAQERQPAFLRFLRQIVDGIRATGKPVGMCGDMAADPQNLPLVLGLGLDEISVPASEISGLKRRVRRLSAAWCEQLLGKAAACEDVKEVDELLRTGQAGEPPLALLLPELVVLNQPSETKQEVIGKIADSLYLAGRTEDARLIEEALWEREAISSTALGHGFAIPHCKTDAISADSVGIFKLSGPIAWGSADDEPVRMVILLAVRQSQSGNRHLQILSRLARKLMDEEFRARMFSFQEAPELLAYLSRELDL
jgi:multiphosphoryl transfer protein